MNIRFMTNSKITSDVMKLVRNELINIDGLKDKEFEVWVNAEMDSILIELKEFLHLQDVGSGATETLNQITNNTLDVLKETGIEVVRVTNDNSVLV